MDGLSPEQCRCWLALNRVSGLGAAAFERLRRRAGSITAVFDLSPGDLADAGMTKRQAGQILDPDWRHIDRDCEWLSQPGHALLPCADDRYPVLLRETPGPPLLLFVIGDPALLARPQLAIVGSRNPTPGGRESAAGFAARLARRGYIITSGMATGIDAAAHGGALDANGSTVAVLGCGPDRIYPRRHKDLAERIRGHGALISEFPPGTPPVAANFPRRNRIISGLSLGVLVIEAALRSGSLITARCAAEQGREVFAVPGSIQNPLARGCHALIRQGAKLAESIDDIVEELDPLQAVAENLIASGSESGSPVQDINPDDAVLLQAMGDAPVSVDLLVERSGLTADAVSSMLLLFELRGLVAAQPGGMYSRLR